MHIDHWLQLFQYIFEHFKKNQWESLFINWINKKIKKILLLCFSVFQLFCVIHRDSSWLPALLSDLVWVIRAQFGQSPLLCLQSAVMWFRRYHFCLVVKFDQIIRTSLLLSWILSLSWEVVGHSIKPAMIFREISEVWLNVLWRRKSVKARGFWEMWACVLWCQMCNSGVSKLFLFAHTA